MVGPAARDRPRLEQAAQGLEIAQSPVAELLYQRVRIQIKPNRLQVDHHAEPRAFSHRLGTHEVRVADARTRRPHGQFLIHFGISLQQRLHGAVPNRMRGELQTARDSRAHHRDQPFLRNEPHSAVIGIANAVNRAHAPGLKHISAAREHPAVQKSLDADDVQPVVAIFEQRVLADPADAVLDVRERTDRLDVLRKAHPHGQFVARPQLLVGLDLVRAGVAVAHAGQPR